MRALARSALILVSAGPDWDVVSIQKLGATGVLA